MSTPCTYLALRAIIPFMDTNTRIQSSLKTPSVHRYFSRLPMNIDHVKISSGQVTIDSVTYKFTRLVSWFPKEETEFVQFTINNVPVQLIHTKAPVKKILNTFLKRIFVGPVTIKTLELRTTVTADLQLMVDNLKIGALEADYSPILSPHCLPLKSFEILNWKSGFTVEDSDLLILPDTQHSELATVAHPRVHIRSLTPGPGFVPPFLMHLLDAWVVYRSLNSNHWSFEISSPSAYVHYVIAIRMLQVLDVQTVDEQYHVTTPNLPGEILKIFCRHENGTHHLHLKFEKTH